MTDTETEANPTETIERLGLTVSSTFVPFSQSRSAKEAKTASDLSLNWRVTVALNGRPFLETDYMQGIGHAPARKASVRALGNPNSLMRFEALQYEAEKGREAPRTSIGIGGKSIAPPSAADVLYSLTMDAGALDYATFTDWANEYGYDPDSRAAEAIYKACLEIALKMRNAIGDSGLEALQQAFRDY